MQPVIQAFDAALGKVIKGLVAWTITSAEQSRQ